MEDVIRLTRGIHQFVRGEHSFEEGLELLKEKVESEEWLNHLEMELLLHEMALKGQVSDSTTAIESDGRRRYNRHPRKVKGAEYNYPAST